MVPLQLLIATGLAALMPGASAQTHSTTTTSTATQGASTQVDNTDRSAAQYWGLSLDDYRRYQALMKGVRGAISDPRISPIEVLGIHARDDAERRRYAEMFARLMAEDTQRVLQFQVEYDRAFRRLYPSLVAFEGAAKARRSEGAPTRHAGMSLASAATPGDRLLVFTREGCTACDELVRHATTLVQDGSAFADIYLVGAKSPDDVQRYAVRLALDPGLISARRLTLNVDAGTFARVLPAQPALPALVRKRGEGLVQLAVTELQR